MFRILCILTAVIVVASCQTQRGSVAGRSPTPTPSTAANPLFPDLQRATSPRPAGACYGDAEMRAEELVRLRTQMMLAGLTCRGSFRSGDPFSAYQRFIVSQQGAIRDAQNTLGSWLSRYQGGSPGRLYDTFQTEMANNLQRQMLNQGTGTFCQRFEPKFNLASQFTPATLSSYLDQAVSRYGSSYPSC